MKKIALFSLIAAMVGVTAADAGWRERLGLAAKSDTAAPAEVAQPAPVEQPAPVVEEAAVVVTETEPVVDMVNVAGNEAEMAVEEGTTVVQEMEEPAGGFVPNPEPEMMEE